jgi:hypothetical protein
MTLAVNIAQSGSNNVTFRNRIINGGMVIDQRNAGAVTTPTTNSYIIDRWAVTMGAASKFTTQLSTTAPNGFTSSLLFTTTTATTGSYFYTYQRIEGFNWADLGWGTANAKTVTLSFWVRSSVTGSHDGFIRDSVAAVDTTYTYSISTANTWEYKSVTIAGVTTGTYSTTNGIGAGIYINIANEIAVSGATFYITGVQLEAGTTASPFEYRQYGTEFILCQRYYEKTYDTTTAIGSSTAVGFVNFCGALNAGQNVIYPITFTVAKRAGPTMSSYKTDGSANIWVWSISGSSNNNATPTFDNIGTHGCRSYVLTTGAAWATGEIQGHWVASAEL